jgi:hypothetical protein
MCNCASKNFKFLKLHFYCEICAMHIAGPKLCNVTLTILVLEINDFVSHFIFEIKCNTNSEDVFQHIGNRWKMLSSDFSLEKMQAVTWEKKFLFLEIILKYEANPNKKKLKKSAIEELCYLCAALTALLLAGCAVISWEAIKNNNTRHLHNLLIASWFICYSIFKKILFIYNIM